MNTNLDELNYSSQQKCNSLNGKVYRDIKIFLQTP